MSNEEEVKELKALIGKQVKEIEYTGYYSAPITIIFTDGTVLEIDAEGDDMTHTTFSIQNKPK
jgi:hypothetical protein